MVGAFHTGLSQPEERHPRHTVGFRGEDLGVSNTFDPSIEEALGILLRFCLSYSPREAFRKPWLHFYPRFPWYLVFEDSNLQSLIIPDMYFGSLNGHHNW